MGNQSWKWSQNLGTQVWDMSVPIRMLTRTPKTCPAFLALILFLLMKISQRFIKCNWSHFHLTINQGRVCLGLLNPQENKQNKTATKMKPSSKDLSRLIFQCKKLKTFLKIPDFFNPTKLNSLSKQEMQACIKEACVDKQVPGDDNHGCQFKTCVEAVVSLVDIKGFNQRLN